LVLRGAPISATAASKLLLPLQIDLSQAAAGLILAYPSGRFRLSSEAGQITVSQDQPAAAIFCNCTGVRRLRTTPTGSQPSSQSRDGFSRLDNRTE
jgi:hypothetical protein